LSADPFKTRKPRFLSEQDGPSEQVLKVHLTNYLTCVPDVERAYLVKVAQDRSSSYKAALCLVGGSAKAIEIAQSVGVIFRQFFQATENLDVVFLNDEQRGEVSAVANPFYKSDGQDHCRPN
jgi:hypothetical protein